MQMTTTRTRNSKIMIWFLMSLRIKTQQKLPMKTTKEPLNMWICPHDLQLLRKTFTPQKCRATTCHQTTKKQGNGCCTWCKNSLEFLASDDSTISRNSRLRRGVSSRIQRWTFIHQTSQSTSIQDGINAMISPTLRSSGNSLDREWNFFESTGQRSSRLTHLLDALKSIQPTSTSCEQSFSVAGAIKTKIQRKSETAYHLLNWTC